MQFPVVIGLRRSRILPAILMGVAVLAVIAALGWAPEFHLGIALAAACILVAAFALRTCCRELPTMMFMGDGSTRVADTPGAEFRPVRILPGGIVHPWLTVFRYREEAGRTAQVIVAVDSTGDDDFRRLRLLLRWQRPVSDAGVPP